MSYMKLLKSRAFLRPFREVSEAISDEGFRCGNDGDKTQFMFFFTG
jgi:hypothetical protein